MLALQERSPVDHIMRYPFSQVREKMLMEGGVEPAQVDEAIEEFRKYLHLIALGHSSLGMFSKEVDKVWHTFILFTRDYAEFCQKTFGFFLHHQPALRSRPLGNGSRERFFTAYRQQFGEPPSIWIAGSDCSPDTGGGGDECSPTPSCDGAPWPK